MGIRGELFSTRFSCEGRTYFFNVKENRNGDIFLSVVESKPTETETYDRRSIVVFQENMEGFMRAMRTAAGYMEKAGPRAKPEAAPHQPMRARPAASSPENPQGGAARIPRRIVIKKKPQSSDSKESKSKELG
ncbi:MAG: DUF3276 family protein [Rectinema sp.]